MLKFLSTARTAPVVGRRIQITEALLAELRAQRIFLRPKFDFGDALGKTVLVANAVAAEPYARISEAALAWDAPVRIGAFSYVTPGASMAGCDIGRFCSIASGARVMSEGHPMDRASTSTWSYGQGVQELVQQDFGVKVRQQRQFPAAARTTIGHDVWIGEMATLKRGITLHTGCVVGAHALVTRDVPPYAVVAGNPARVVKHRFEPPLIEALLASAWWELHPAQLAPLDMCEPAAFAAEAARLLVRHPADWRDQSLLALFQAHGAPQP